MSDIIVRFKPENHGELIRAIEKLQKAQKGVTATTQQVTDATKKQKKSNSGLLTSQRLLGGSFASLRSHMLLYSFGMSLGIRQTVQFAKEATKVQQMEKAFIGLSGGVDISSSALNKLTNATNGAMNDFDLFQQSNNAMILGITRNSDEMAQMFDMAQRLGDALGRDVKTSVESLVTGIGRQSRLMLDNIGIIVKADKAYANYARELGKTADTLTESEKKQAFMNAALEAGREKLKFLPDETMSASKTFQIFSATLSNFQVILGEQALPTIVMLADNMTKLMKAFDAKRVEAYAKVIKMVLAGAMAFYTKQVIKAVVAQTRLGWGALATAAGVLASEILLLSGVLNEPNKGLKDTNENIVSYLESLKSMKEEEISAEINKQKEAYKNAGNELTRVMDNQKFYIQLLENEKAAIEPNIDAIKKYENELKEIQKAISLLIGVNLSDSQKRERAAIQETIETLREYRSILQSGFSSINSYTDSQNIALDMYQKTTEAAIENNKANIDMIDNLIEAEKRTDNNAETLAKYAAVKEMLTNQEIELNSKLVASEQQVANAKLKTASLVLKAGADVIGMSEKNAKAAALVQAAAAIVDAYASALSTKAQVAKSAPPPFPSIAYYATLASGLVAARQIAMSANSIGGGSSGGGGGTYGKFEQGGYVGGRPHSQGGTIIEAERGEFVMSRNAVESIGLETLNQMNQSGGGGNINVNVSGNVLTQDFVEGELAESIKEAVRRGSDFGIG